MNQKADEATQSPSPKPWWVEVWTATPKWLIVLLLLAIFALLAMSAYFGPVMVRGEPFFGFPDRQTFERALTKIATPENQYTGFYRDWEVSRGHMENTEELYLDFSDDDLVLGFSRGQKPGDPESWLERGYYKGDSLTLAYKSQGHGERLGAYLLQRHATRSVVYLGFWEGFKSGRRLRCPYVLVKGQIDRGQLDDVSEEVLASECVIFARDPTTANFPLIDQPLSIYNVKISYRDFAADYVEQLSSDEKACIQQDKESGVEPSPECNEVISNYHFLLPYEDEDGYGRLFIYARESIDFAGVLTYLFPGEEARIVMDAETVTRRGDGGWNMVFKQPPRLVDVGGSLKRRAGDTWTVKCEGSVSLCDGTVYDPRNHRIVLGQFEMSAE